MPDEEQDTAGPPPRPTAPKPKRDPIVIEGKAQESGGLGPKPGPAPAPAAPAPRGLARPIAAGAVGGAIGALLTIGGVWLFDTGPDPIVLARRMDALDAAQSDAAAARKTAADRITALESAGAAATTEQKSLSDKLSALAAAPATSSDDARRLSELEAAAKQQKALAEQLAEIKTAASAATQELEKRIAALEAVRPANETPVRTALPQAVPDPRVAGLAADQASLSDRLGKLEAAVFSATAETRVAAEETQSAEAPAQAPARAIVALALQTRVRAGEPYSTELAALQTTGADAAAVEPLKPYAESGVPTFAALLSLFREAAPKIDAAGRPALSGGVVDRVLGEVQGLVKVRKVGESPSAEAGVDASPIAAALASGDLAGAIAAAESLPGAPRAAAADWAKAARARLEAMKAADTLAERSIAELGAAKK
jgi:hypothetical protein